MYVAHHAVLLPVCHALQLLPDTLANTLVQLLLKFHRLHTATQLDAFRDCVTTLRLDAGSGVHLDAEWLAHICSLRCGLVAWLLTSCMCSLHVNECLHHNFY